MTVALAIRPAPSPTATAEKLEHALSMAADGVTLRAFPPIAEIEQARVELVRAIEARPTPAQVRQNIGRLVLAYPQHLRAESPEVFIAALESEAAGYPLDVLALACRNILRTSRFVPSVAELVEQCEAVQEKRRRLLLGAQRLKREAERHLAERQEREQREAERAAYHRKVDAAMAARWGDAVPEWWSLERAWRGAVECGAHGRPLAEQWAAGGDGPSWIYCRRAALYALAREMETATLPGRHRLLPADLLALASHLARDEDAAAVALVESPTPPPSPEDAEPPSRVVIVVLMKRALSATREAAQREGLGELSNHGDPPPFPNLEGTR